MELTTNRHCQAGERILGVEYETNSNFSKNKYDHVSKTLGYNQKNIITPGCSIKLQPPPPPRPPKEALPTVENEINTHTQGALRILHKHKHDQGGSFFTAQAYYRHGLKNRIQRNNIKNYKGKTNSSFKG